MGASSAAYEQVARSSAMCWGRRRCRDVGGAEGPDEEQISVSSSAEYAGATYEQSSAGPEALLDVVGEDKVIHTLH